MIAFTLNSWLILKNAEMLELLLITFFFCLKAEQFCWLEGGKLADRPEPFYYYTVVHCLQRTGSRSSCDL